MRNKKLDDDDRLAYNEQNGFYYYKNSDKIAALFIAQDTTDSQQLKTEMGALSLCEQIWHAALKYAEKNYHSLQKLKAETAVCADTLDALYRRGVICDEGNY